jgi:hypothetical protein
VCRGQMAGDKKQRALLCRSRWPYVRLCRGREGRSLQGAKGRARHEAEGKGMGRTGAQCRVLVRRGGRGQRSGFGVEDRALGTLMGRWQNARWAS